MPPVPLYSFSLPVTFTLPPPAILLISFPCHFLYGFHCSQWELVTTIVVISIHGVIIYPTCCFYLVQIRCYSTFSSLGPPDFTGPKNQPTKKRLTEAQKAAIVIPAEITEVITGMILSDASIALPPGCHNARVHIEQQDESFVCILWNLFDSIGLVGAPPKLRNRTDKKRGLSWTAFSFATFTHPFFTELHKIWYKNVEGKAVKVLPSNIAELLTPVAIAFLLSGDGSYCKSTGRITICTDSFTAEEVDCLRSIFLDQFGIETTRIRNGHRDDQYVIRIPKREVPKVQQLVQSHLPAMMRYRVGL
jgi:hypothetical protein